MLLHRISPPIASLHHLCYSSQHLCCISAAPPIAFPSISAPSLLLLPAGQRMSSQLALDMQCRPCSVLNAIKTGLNFLGWMFSEHCSHSPCRCFLQFSTTWLACPAAMLSYPAMATSWAGAAAATRPSPTLSTCLLSGCRQARQCKTWGKKWGEFLYFSHFFIGSVPWYHYNTLGD